MHLIETIKDLGFSFFLTKPTLPAIIIAGERLYAAYKYREIAENCIKSNSLEEQVEIKILDSSNREYYYSPEHQSLMPNILALKWTKKKIIETFNNSLNAKENDLHYPVRYIPSRRYDRIFSDICKLINESNKKKK